MSQDYHEGQRRLQDRFDTRRLADRIDSLLVRETLDDGDRAWAEASCHMSTISQQERSA